MHVVITMPVYNDWQSAAAVTLQLEQVLLESSHHTATILLIDDGSSVGPDSAMFDSLVRAAICDVRILQLGRNLGHQRAIAIALAYINESMPCDAVVVMDADGEDRAGDVPRLLEAISRQTFPAIVFAERGRRVEGAVFKAGYFCYRALHRFATGTGIRVGNFSVIPQPRLKNLVVLSELWNHYAAAVLKARIPSETIRVDRGARLHGRSKMNFVSLVIHGFSALFAHHELVGTRLFVGLLGATLALMSVFTLLAAVWIYHGWSLPLWQIVLMSTLVSLGCDLLAISFGLVFFIMMSRSNQAFLPVRDYSHFVVDCVSLFPSPFAHSLAS